jgi:phosphomannomutase
MAQGFDVLDCDIVPTPTVQYMVIREQACAGVIVTSSHNPIDWNGLKFVSSDGLFLAPDYWKDIIELAANPSLVSWPSYDKIGSITPYPDAGKNHIDAILSLPEIKIEQIQARKFKVVLDTVNGAGGPVMTQLLQRLGCEVVELNTAPTGIFAHEPEPVPAHLHSLGHAVREHKAHLGIATDPDVDRCVLMDNEGHPIGEEYTLALAVQFWLGTCGKRGVVVKNLSTSRVIDDIAEDNDCEVVATPIGEIHVAMKMAELKATIGGEGNGGVMLPNVHIGRDAPVAATLVLQLLSGWEGTFRELRKALPSYHIVKLKANTADLTADLDAYFRDVAHKWKARGAEVSTMDGVHISTPRWWVHLRKSNTEPIVRVIAEAAKAEDAEHVARQFLEAIESNGLFSPRV